MADLGLARRAVAATGWRVPTPTVTESSDGRLTYRSRSGVLWVDVAPPGPDGEWLPDLDDPATVGCLLALVRERWGDPSLAPLLIDGRWHIGAGSARSVHMYGATEGGVLVIALEAAP